MKEKDKNLESLDKKTCDTVMQDLSICIEEWVSKDLDTKAAVITLLKFTVDISFEYSETQLAAIQLIYSAINEHFFENDSDDIEIVLRQIKSEKKIIH